jgi:hypothetical protein
MGKLSELAAINRDLVVAVEHAADALEIIGASDPSRLDDFKRHSDGFLQRLHAARDEIAAHAELMDELNDASGAVGDEETLLVYKTRLAPARQRLHLVHLRAASASDTLRACMANLSASASF